MDQLAGDIVLVVDDSPESLGFLTEALDQAGYTTLVAQDGSQALEQMQRVRPDVVLLDAMMPGMDGFETCRRIKSNPELSQVPVIFMTGLADTRHIVEGLNAGGVDYVAKPIVVEQLLARVRVHLANAKAAQGTRLALDAAGRAMLSIRADGCVSWYTAQAGRLLDSLGVDIAGRPDVRVDAQVTSFLARIARSSDGVEGERLELQGKMGRIRFTCVERLGASEYLVRLEALACDDDDRAMERRLAEQFELTSREAEVLLWLARGKTNRDIAEILSMSPRTVNKHLEHVFEKLGVENRSAATSAALRVVGAR